MLPEEEDLDFESDSEDEETEEEIDDFLIKPTRRLIINVSALQKYLLETTVCKFCGESQTIFEHKSQKHGLGTKLTFQCANNCNSGNGFFTTEKNITYDINKKVCIAMRAI